MSSSSQANRDPVCVSIEEFLQELEADGRGVLNLVRRDNFVRISFGSLSVEAETLDIGLVRLANAMIDDPIYGPMVMSVLRGRV